MIDPWAIIKLKPGAVVQTEDGDKTDISSIAIWDLREEQTENLDQAYIELYTNSGRMWVLKGYIDDIIKVNQVSCNPHSE